MMLIVSRCMILHISIYIRIRQQNTSLAEIFFNTLHCVPCVLHASSSNVPKTKLMNEIKVKSNDKYYSNMSMTGFHILWPCFHLVLKCVLGDWSTSGQQPPSIQGTFTQTSCQSNLGCMWPGIFCNVNVNVSWWVPDKDVPGNSSLTQDMVLVLVTAHYCGVGGLGATDAHGWSAGK